MDTLRDQPQKKFTWAMRSVASHEAFRATIVAGLIDFFRDFEAFGLLGSGEIGAAAVQIAGLFVAGYIVQAVARKLFSTAEAVFETDMQTRLTEIVEGSSHELTIVSPYFRPGNVLTELLLKRAREGVVITVLHATDQINKAEFLSVYSRLNAAGISLYNHPQLHAKIYMNDDTALVGSSNLVAASAANSIEAAILVSHPKLLKALRNKVAGTLSSDRASRTSIAAAVPDPGFCIKTGRKLAYNPSRPVAFDVYRQDSSAPGAYCHYCGQPADTSILRPFCQQHMTLGDGSS